MLRLWKCLQLTRRQGCIHCCVPGYVTGYTDQLHSVHVAAFHRISAGSWTVFVVLTEPEPEPDFAPTFSCEIQVAAVELPKREVGATPKGRD